MPDFGLGRIYAPDTNDHRFLLPPRQAEAKGIVRRTWWAGDVLDQGNTSACVGYSTYKFLQAAPVRNKPDFTPFGLYLEAQALDPWPGEEPDVKGSSVRAAMKALQARGLVSGYHWAFSCEPAIDHMLAVSPMVFGTNWYERMFYPDKHGYLWPEGVIVGGHAWLGGVTIDRERKNPDGTVGAIRKIGSWGRSWGQGGRAWIAFHVLDRLIREDGEAAIATEVLKA